jgi:hypothetical protein
MAPGSQSEKVGSRLSEVGRGASVFVCPASRDPTFYWVPHDEGCVDLLLSSDLFRTTTGWSI